MFDTALNTSLERIKVNTKKKRRQDNNKKIPFDVTTRWVKMVKNAAGQKNSLLIGLSKLEEKTVCNIILNTLLMNKMKMYNHYEKNKIIKIMKETTVQNYKSNWYAANVAFNKIGQLYNVKSNIKQSIYPVINEDGVLVEDHKEIANAHAAEMNKYNKVKNKRNKNNRKYNFLSKKNGKKIHQKFNVLQ
eukprot:UN01909